MTSRRRTLLYGVLTATALSACTSQGPTGPVTDRPASQATLPAGTRARVERVVDGDTLIVGGQRVRLIGIDAPESVKPDSPVECFGPEASKELARLLPRRTPVLLEFDVDRTDRYDRTLAYVWRTDPVELVNLALVRGGFATVDTFPPNTRHEAVLEQAETAAQTDGLGLWTSCP